MANIKSSKKRIKVTLVKTQRNTMIKSALKTKVKKFETAVATGNVEEAKVTYANVVKALDMAVTKGILHINKAARRKSRLATKLNNLSLTA
ncbi:30S ribosomal protein S20 [Clostridium bowmanii]|uniref:30S ribosomal protein S20 n=1 Tax=Clostridium bowmanii TaxID=132925 RepID=UPI001C0B0DBC|nr:30S ribosomal protein S20 [Clostridium bowmanii]MBU3189717.1 30S ribosomal protein S20 [Clostridium bowmanii]MCA1074199.1 30S ribosomal protein S20 [Clostridium bowmanii]